MRITVLGKSPSWQDAGGACSGYLVEQGDFALLLDCGSGVFAKLRAERDYTSVDAVLLTHLHADHFLDLVPFSYALQFAPRPNGDAGDARGEAGQERARPALYAPPGGRDFFRRLVSCWGNEDLVETSFKLREYEPADKLTIGPLTVRFCRVPHYTAAYAVQFSAGGGSFTFGADCGPNEELVRFARETDLLLIESTQASAGDDEEEPRGHLTPREAGEHGRRAGAGTLVVTHFSDQLDPEWVRAEARDGFGGPVELAAERAVYEID